MEGRNDEFSIDLEKKRDDFSNKELDEHPGSEMDYSTSIQSNTPSLPAPAPEYTP